MRYKTFLTGLTLFTIVSILLNACKKTNETIVVLGPWESEDMLKGAMQTALPSLIKIMWNNQIWITGKAKEPGYILSYSILNQKEEDIKTFEKTFKEAYPNKKANITPVALKITIPKNSPEIVEAIRNVFFQLHGIGTYIPANTQIHWFSPE